MAHRIVIAAFGGLGGMLATTSLVVKGEGCCDAPNGNVCDKYVINEKSCSTDGDPNAAAPCGNVVNNQRGNITKWTESNFGFFIHLNAAKSPCQITQSCAPYTDPNTGQIYCDLGGFPPRGASNEDTYSIDGDCPGAV